jgi:hypothetical protein
VVGVILSLLLLTLMMAVMRARWGGAGWSPWCDDGGYEGLVLCHDAAGP